MTNPLCMLGLHNTPKNGSGYKSWHCERCQKLMINFPKMIIEAKRELLRLVRKESTQPIDWSSADMVVSNNGRDVNYVKLGPTSPEITAALRKLRELQDDMQSMR